MTIAAQKLKVLLTVVMEDRDLVINVKSCGGVQALCAPAPEQLLEAKPDDIVLVAGHVPGLSWWILSSETMLSVVQTFSIAAKSPLGRCSYAERLLT